MKAHAQQPEWHRFTPARPEKSGLVRLFCSLNIRLLFHTLHALLSPISSIHVLSKKSISKLIHAVRLVLGE